MELKEAYKQAFKEEVQALIDSGKIALLNSLEDTVSDFADAMAKAIEKGALLSDTKIDDMAVPAFLPYLKSIVDKQIDKIDGEVG